MNVDCILSLKAKGVPTCIVLDKDGKQSFHSVGFPGADVMKKELLKAGSL